MAAGVRAAAEWLPDVGMARFHRWAFATLRQCGATAELAADYAAHLDAVRPGAGAAESQLRGVAAAARSVQFKMARAASGRTVDVDAGLAAMARGWQTGLDIIAASVG